MSTLQKTSSEQLNDFPNVIQLISNTTIMNQVFMISWYCFLFYKDVSIIKPVKLFQVVYTHTNNYNSHLQGAVLYLQAHLFLKRLSRAIGNQACGKGRLDAFEGIVVLGHRFRAREINFRCQVGKKFWLQQELPVIFVVRVFLLESGLQTSSHCPVQRNSLGQGQGKTLYYS